MVRVYRDKNFNVYAGDDDTYVIHNMRKEFKNGHTHVRKFKTCKFIIDLAKHKSIPRTSSTRIIDSIIRISDDETYITKLMNYKKNKKKKDPYINRR